MLRSSVFVLFGTPGDSASRQIVRRHLDGYLITGQDSDKIHSKLSGYMREYLVPVGQFYLKHRVRQCLYDGTFKLNYVFL